MNTETFTGTVAICHCRTCGHFWAQPVPKGDALCPHDHCPDDPHAVHVLDDVRLSAVPSTVTLEVGPVNDLRECFGDRVEHAWPREYVLDRDRVRFEPCSNVADRAAAREMSLALNRDRRGLVLGVVVVVITIALVIAGRAG